MGITWRAIPLLLCLSLDRTSFQLAGPCRPSLASRRRLGLPSQGPPLQNMVVIQQSKTREDRSLFKVLGLRSQLPVRLGVALDNRPKWPPRRCPCSIDETLHQSAPQISPDPLERPGRGTVPDPWVVEEGCLFL